MLILALLGGSQAAVYSDSWLSTLFPTTVFLAYLAIHGENITVGRKFLLKSQTKREKQGQRQSCLLKKQTLRNSKCSCWANHFPGFLNIQGKLKSCKNNPHWRKLPSFEICFLYVFVCLFVSFAYICYSWPRTRPLAPAGLEGSGKALLWSQLDKKLDIWKLLRITPLALTQKVAFL